MQVADLFAKLGLRTDKRQFQVADKLLGHVKKALVGIAAFQSVRWFGSLITDTALAADEMVKMSAALGVNYEALQQLEYAAGLSGAGMSDLETGLRRFSRNAYDASQGTGAAAEEFTKLGITLKDTEGKLRSAPDLLNDLADRFAKMPDGTKKTAIAMTLLGRSGTKMIPLLNEGSEGINALRQEFVDLGAQISRETAADFETFNDNQDRVKTALIGLRNQAVIALLPKLLEASEAMIAWVKANKMLIRQKLQSILEGVVSAAKVLGKVLVFVVKIFEFWHENSTLVNSVLLGLAGILLTLKAVSVGAAIASAVAWLASMLPFVLLAAAILAVIVIIEDLYKWMTGTGKSQLKIWYNMFVDYLRNKFPDLFNEETEVWKSIFKAFFRWLGEAALEASGAIVDGLRHVGRGLAEDAFGEGFADWWYGDDKSSDLRDMMNDRRNRVPESTQAEKLVRAQQNLAILQSALARINKTPTSLDGPVGNFNKRSILQQIEKVEIRIDNLQNASPEEVGKAVKKEFDSESRKLQAVTP